MKLKAAATVSYYMTSRSMFQRCHKILNRLINACHDDGTSFVHSLVLNCLHSVSKTVFFVHNNMWINYYLLIK